MKKVMKIVRHVWSFLNKPLIVAFLSIWVLNKIYTYYNMIDTLNKTFIYLPYAYEYDYRGATNERGNRLKEILYSAPIEININEEKSFRFGISNKNFKSLKDVSLSLIFPKGVEVKDWDKQGWIEYQPNEEYTHHFYYNIHNGMGQNANPLRLKFSKEGDYIVNYYISGEDIQRKDQKFIVRIK